MLGRAKKAVNRRPRSRRFAGHGTERRSVGSEYASKASLVDRMPCASTACNTPIALDHWQTQPCGERGHARRRPGRRGRSQGASGSPCDSQGTCGACGSRSLDASLSAAQRFDSRADVPGLRCARRLSPRPPERMLRPLHRAAPLGTDDARSGEVSEWSNEPDSKSGVQLAVPWVRIPPSPPEKQEAAPGRPLAFTLALGALGNL